MKYFAYGSNLLPERLLRRIPAARLLTTASLPGHQLCFHKRGGDESGKCDAMFTGRPSDCVLGAIYDISIADREVLDRVEGPGYRTVETAVQTPGGIVQAYLYQAETAWIDGGLLPFDWYHQLVLHGARFHGFHNAYVEGIAGVSVQADPDALRRNSNLDILSGFLVQ
jgi:gamma-glutamylcyclotransferase